MQNVHVRYGFSDRAQAHLAFAAGLAQRLSASLFVWTHRDIPAAAFLKKRTGADVITKEQTHIRDRVRWAVGLIAPELVPRFATGNPAQDVCGEDSVLVDEAATRPADGTALLAPMGERAYDARGTGGICLPFGNGDSALDGLGATLKLARKLKLPMLFYHTTWRESGLPETASPEAHMIEGAKATQRKLEAAADAAGVAHRAVIETAASIAEGICRVALNERCAMIALTRGRHVGRGSYVNDVLVRTTVPVFVTGRSS